MQPKLKIKRSGGSAVFLAIFGLPFLGFGCFMGQKTLTLIQDWYAARSWTETDATLNSLELKDKGDSDGSSYLVVATYTYTFDGKSYHANRVGLIPDADNIGSWQEDTHARLNEHFKRREPVTCYVDPADPGNALLDRELRIGMLGIHLFFVLIFGGIGCGLFIGGIVSTVRSRTKRNLLEQHPDAPWLADPAWASGTIKAATRSTAIWLWIIAIFWNGISSVVPFAVIPKAIDERAWWALLFLLFPAVGMLILYAAVRETLRHFRFGRSRFELKTMPGVIGGRLKGDLVVVGRTDSIGAVEVTLQCKRTVRQGCGRNRTIRTEVVWSNTTTVDSIANFGGRISLPVDFEIPYSCQPTADQGGDGDISWHLTAAADIPGVNLALDFKVPVFKTDASDPTVGDDKIEDLEHEGLEHDESSLNAFEPPETRTIQMETDMAGNSCYRNTAMPSVGFLIMMLVLSLGFTVAAGYFGWLLVRGDWAALIGVLGFGFFDLIFCLVMLSFFGSYRAVFTRDALVLRRSFVLFSKTRSVPWADITEVSHKQTASSGAQKWFTVNVQSLTQRRVTVLGMIKGEPAACWFVRQIEKRLRKDRRRPGATGGLGAGANPRNRPTSPSQSPVPL